MYGAGDNRTLRVDEIAGSIQRFEWAIERATSDD
jgi:hypothetical protein